MTDDVKNMDDFYCRNHHPKKMPIHNTNIYIYIYIYIYMYIYLKYIFKSKIKRHIFNSEVFWTFYAAFNSLQRLLTSTEIINFK